MAGLNAFRDVIVWDLNDSEDRTPLGGMILTPGLTNADFHQMLDVLVVASGDYVVLNEHGDEVLRDAEPLLPGNYVIAGDDIEVNDEVTYARALSVTTGTRVHAFRDAVRARDGRCVVSKVENLNARVGYWSGFEAAHIFPLACEHQWIQNNYGRWITVDPPQGGKINSVRNGILLRSDIHQIFDTYGFSINPDNGYKIVFFILDQYGIAGQTLDRRLLDDPLRPPDSLLRWHFRQAVLTNVRGAGEPVHEHDFPPGSDVVGEILAGPKAAERMEFELFDRLAHHTDIA